MNDKQRSSFEKKMLAQLEAQAQEKLAINTDIKECGQLIYEARGEPDSAELAKKFKKIFGKIDKSLAKRSEVNAKMKRYSKELKLCINEMGKWAEGQINFPDPGDEASFLKIIKEYEEEQKALEE